MRILENLKLDKWYGIILYLGILLVGASLYFQTAFFNLKHLFGLGTGMVMIGLSQFIAETSLTEINPFSYKLTINYRRQNIVTAILLTTGVILIGIFGFLIIRSLL